MLKKLTLQIAGATMALAMLFTSPVLAHDEFEELETQIESQIESELAPLTTDYEFDYEDYSYEDMYTNQLSEDEAAALAAVIALVGGIGLFVLAGIAFISYIYGSWTLMVIAQKVGEESPWMAWVPVLNIILMLKVAKMSPWLVLLIIVPFVNIVLFVIVMMKVAERRGFPNWLGLLCLVPVANIILPGYLAFAEPSK